MAFTTRTITHNFTNADGTPASGSVRCTLTQRMTNGTTTMVPAQVTSNLNGSGALSVSLTSNLDAGTAPTGAQWRIDLNILGDQEETYYIVVPTGPGTTDLGSLLPAAQQVG